MATILDDITISYPRGFCYLHWFKRSKFGPLELQIVKDYLGPFPIIRDVLVVLGDLAARYGDCFPGCQKVSPDTVHVSYKYGVWTWATIIRFIKQKKLKKLKIGGVEDEHGVVTAPVLDAAVLSELFKIGGHSAKAALNEYVNDQMLKPEGDMKNMLVNSVINTIKTKTSLRKSAKLIINYRLSALEMTTLAEEFSELQLDFTNKFPHKHAMAAAVRRCEESLILLKAEYFSCKFVPENYDVAIKDIGGNPRSHFERKRFNVHSCQPVVCARTAERVTQCMIYLRGKRYSDYGHLLKNEETSRLLLCRRRPHLCPIKAPKVMFLHSMYAMSGRDIADAMDSASAYLGFGVIMFDPNIIWADKGFIESIGCDWYIERKDTRDQDMVHFFFKEDSSFGYSHNLKNYLSLFASSHIKSSRGVIYFLQITDYRCGSAHFSFTRNMTEFIPKSFIRHRIWNQSMQGKVQIKYYEYHPVGYPDTFSVRFSYEMLVVPKKILDLGLNHAYALSTSKFTVNAVYEFLRSANARVVVNGVDVQVSDTLDADTLYKLAHALFIRAFVVRYNSSQMVATITEYIKNERTPKSFKNTLWSYFSNAGYVFTNKPTDKAEHDPFPGFRGKLFFWLSQPQLFNITIEDAVRFREYESVFHDMTVDYEVGDFEKDFINTPISKTAIDVVDQAVSLENMAEIKSVVDQLTKDIIHDDSTLSETTTTNDDAVDDSSSSSSDSSSDTLTDSSETTQDKLSDIDSSVSDGSSISDVTEFCLPQYTVASCSAILRKKSVPADGDCLYHAIIECLKLSDMDPHKLKQLLLNSDVIDQHSQPDAVKDVLMSSRWGNSDVLELVAKHFMVQVCVHDVEREIQYSFFSHGTEKIHLHYDGSHYDALVSDTVDDIPDNVSVSTEAVSESDISEMEEIPYVEPSPVPKLLVKPVLGLLDAALFTVSTVLHPVETLVSAAGVVKTTFTPDPELSGKDLRPVRKIFHHVKHPVNTTAKVVTSAIKTGKTVVDTGVNVTRKITYPVRHPIDTVKTVTNYAVDTADDTVEVITHPVQSTSKVISTITEVKDRTVNTLEEICTSVTELKRSVISSVVSPLRSNPKANLPSIDDAIVNDGRNLHFPRVSVGLDGVKLRRTYVGDKIDKKIAKKRAARVIKNPESSQEKDIFTNLVKDKIDNSKSEKKKVKKSKKSKPLDIPATVEEEINIDFDYSVLPYLSFSPDITPVVNVVEKLSCPPYVEIVPTYVDFKLLKPDYAVDITNGVKINLQVNKFSEFESLLQLVNLLGVNPNPCVFAIQDPIKTLNLKYDHLIQLKELISSKYNNTLRLVCVAPLSLSEYQRFKSLDALPEKKIVYENQSMYEAWRKDGHNYQSYNPIRLDPTTPLNVAKNAMYEQREYWRVKENIIFETYSKMYKQLTDKPLSHADRKKISDGAEGYGLLSKDGAWILRPCFTRKYECVFDGKALIPYGDFKNGCELHNPVVLVGNSLELMQDSKLYAATAGIDVDSYIGVEIENRQGVPGCGKTYNFLHTCRPPTDNFKGDLVLFPTREGAVEFRSKIKLMHPSLTDIQLKTNYRTIDSYLLHGDTTRYPVLMIDEALMVHAGQLLFCVMKSGADKLIMIGDDKQIKFINRVPQCEIIYSDPLKFTTANVHLSISRRCTLTVATLLSPYYDQGMKSTSKITGEMRYERYVNIGQIVKNSNAQYLVFKQTEKNEMLKYGFDNTKTIHEYQGKQHDNIVLVRTTTKKEDIYNQFSHALVAISRHRKTFVYISPVTDDAVGKLVEKSKQINYYNSKQFHHVDNIDLAGGGLSNNNDKFQLSGGGVPVISVFAPEIADKIYYHENVYSCVSKFGYPELPTSSFVSVLERPYQLEQRPFSPVDVEFPDYNVIQEFYDHIFPGNSLHNLKFDSMLVLYSNNHFFLENTSFNPLYKTKVKTVEFDKMRTTLRTACPPSRPNNQIESLLAMIKRNQAVPELAGVKDDEQLSDVMVDRFIRTYLVPKSKSMILKFKENLIRPNSTIISQWLETQPSGTVDKIEQDNHLSMKSLTEYDFMIKSTVKPQLDVNAPYTYSALQTIAYQGKEINAIFCPIFRMLKKRILGLMKNKFMINCDISPDEFSRVLFDKFGPRAFKNKNFLEIDMSKYDKSQGKIMLLFECKLMSMFGIDPEFVRLWYNAHLQTTLKDRNNKVKCKVNYQRKSGDASTFIGNTFFLMAVISVLFNLDDIIFGVFAGDDSLLVGGKEIDKDLNSACAALFNLESKFLRSYHYPYFCSKFLIADNFGYLLVPDPVKLVTKLGRSDLVNPEHVEQYRVSLCDIVQPYQNVLLHDYISKAINERYRTTGDHSNVLKHIFSIVNDSEAFHQLYFSNPEDNICLDPTLPNLD